MNEPVKALSVAAMVHGRGPAPSEEECHWKGKQELAEGEEGRVQGPLQN